jgi:hypothetical protein
LCQGRYSEKKRERESILELKQEPSSDKENADSNVQQMDELLRATWLKKKEVQSKKLKRNKTSLDKLCKGKRKATKAIVSTKKIVNVCSNLDMTQKCCHLTSQTFIGSNKRKKMMYNLK